MGQDQLRMKVHSSDFNVFRKLRVRQGKLVEYLSDISERGEHLDREGGGVEKVLDEEPHNLVLDIRNGYEWDFGRFKGAERPNYGKFREFGDLARRG